jgi:hypothetical protein
VTYIKLVPAQLQRGAVVIDSNNDIAAMVWNGSSFGNQITLETAAPTSTTECADAAYEAGTGRCLLVWAHGGSTRPSYVIWDGSWSAPGTMDDLGSSLHWIHMAADPASSKLMAGASARLARSTFASERPVWDTLLRWSPSH